MGMKTIVVVVVVFFFFFVCALPSLVHSQGAFYLVSNEMENKFQAYNVNWEPCGQFRATINQAPIRSVRVLQSDSALQVFWINRENSGNMEMAKVSLADPQNVLERHIDFEVSETITDIAVDKKGDNIFMTSSTGGLLLGKIEEEIFTRLVDPPKSDDVSAASVYFDSDRRLLFHVACSKDGSHLVTFDGKEMKVTGTVQVPECLFYLDGVTETEEIFGSTYENVYKLKPEVSKVKVKVQGKLEIRSFGVTANYLFLVNDLDSTAYVMDRKTNEWKTIHNLTRDLAPVVTFYEGDCFENETESSDDEVTEAGTKPTSPGNTKLESETIENETIDGECYSPTNIDKQTTETHKPRVEILQETTRVQQVTTGPPTTTILNLIQSGGKKGDAKDINKDEERNNGVKTNGDTEDTTKDTTKDANKATTKDQAKNANGDTSTDDKVPTSKVPKLPQNSPPTRGEPELLPSDAEDESVQNDAPAINKNEGETPEQGSSSKETGKPAKTEAKSAGDKKQERPKVTKDAASSGQDWQMALYFSFILIYLILI